MCPDQPIWKLPETELVYIYVYGCVADLLGVPGRERENLVFLKIVYGEMTYDSIEEEVTYTGHDFIGTHFEMFTILTVSVSKFYFLMKL